MIANVIAIAFCSGLWAAHLWIFYMIGRNHGFRDGVNMTRNGLMKPKK